MNIIRSFFNPRGRSRKIVKNVLLGMLFASFIATQGGFSLVVAHAAEQTSQPGANVVSSQSTSSSNSVSESSTSTSASTSTTGTSGASTSTSSTDTTSTNTVSSQSVLGASCSVAGALAFEGVSDASPNVGETITYTIGGSISPTAATQVTVKGFLPSGLTFVSSTPSVGTFDGSTGTWNIGTLSTITNVSLSFTVTVNAGTEGQTITTNPTIYYVSSPCTTSEAVTPISIRVQPAVITPPPTQYADIAIVKTANVSSTVEGGTVDYTLAVTDNGPSTSTGVVATDVLPHGLTFVNATASTGTYSSSTGNWTIGTLSASSTATLTLAAVANTGTAGTTISNTGTVTETGETDNYPGNNSSTVLVSVAAPSPCTLTAAEFHADEASGTIVINPITLNSASDTASFVITNKTQCSAPVSMSSYEVFILPQNPGWLSTQKLFDVATSTSVAASSTQTFTVTTAPCMTQVDAWYGQAPVTLLESNPYSYPNVPFVLASAFTNYGDLCGATSTPPSADIAIAKTADVATTTPGGTINYTVTVTDNGPATSTGVVATDTLPSDLTFVSATPSQGTYSSSTGAWNVGTVSASSTATLAITAMVNATTSATSVTNIATVSESASTTDPNPSNNTASATVGIESISTCGASDLVFGSDTSNQVDGHNAALVAQPYDSSWTASIPGAAWIWATSTVTDPTVNQTETFTKQFSVNGTPTTATLDLNADNTYSVSVNGTLVAATTSTVNYTLQSEAQFDIASDLHNGTNTISFTVTNIGLASSTPQSNPAGLLYSLNVESNTCGTSPVADISVQKTADVSSTVEGGTVNYTIAVSDLGPATSTDVVATDTLPSGLTFVSATSSQGSYSSSTGTWYLGTMTPNYTATLVITALVNDGTATTTITNIATVGESGGEIDNPGNDTSSVTITVACSTNCGGGGGGGPSDADISILKTANVTTTTEGGTIDYTLLVTALGPNASPAVVATDTLPSTLTFVSATSSEGTYNASSGTWTIGDMAVNATATLEIEATANAGTQNSTITNVATVGEGTSVNDQNPANNTSSASVTVEPNSGVTTADIAINKTVDNATPNVGDTVTYTVTVTDNGPDMATNVDVNDQLPAGLSLISATTTTSTYDMTSGDWYLGNVAPNATDTLVVSAVVNSGTEGQTINNTATVTELSSIVDSNPGNNSSTASIAVQQPACTSNCGGGGGGTTGGGGGASTANISITKTVDNADPAPGATINYTLVAQGLGPSTSIGAVASDTLPAGITFVSASSSMGTYDASNGIWTIGNLNPDQSATLVITATVNASDPIGETITNTGTISESTSVIDENTATNTSSVTITVGGTSGGGGGGSSGGGGGSVSVGGNGGGGGGSVLGASTSTGQVLGASTCGLYLTQYIHPIRKDLNDPNEVKKLQVFLNQNLGLNIPVTGYYGNETIAAVNQFQVKYHIEVLQPWVPYGLPTQFTPTEYVYKTTQRWINLIECSALNLPIPPLP